MISVSTQTTYMTSVLLIEDREILKSLFAELIQNFWPEDQELDIQVCGFDHIEDLVSEKKHDIYIFNIASNTAFNFERIKGLIDQGKLSRSKVIISSVSKPPLIETQEDIEIHYCNEDKFGVECLPIMLN